MEPLEQAVSYTAWLQKDSLLRFDSLLSTKGKRASQSVWNSIG